MNQREIEPEVLEALCTVHNAAADIGRIERETVDGFITRIESVLNGTDPDIYEPEEEY